METFIYFIVFVIGTLLGSFCTLAVYRIPLKKDITHEQSFCPKCGHKLVFLDLIPVLSYLFLGGKCRYCKEKIRIRYFLIELFTGLIVLLFAISINFSFANMQINKLVYFIFGILYIVTLILIAGIDKEKKTIQKSLIIFGTISMTIYILYLSIVGNANIDRYAIYLFVMLVLFILDKVLFKKNEKNNYTLHILMLILLMLLFVNSETFILTASIALILIAIDVAKRNKNESVPIGFYLCISNLLMLIVQNFVYFY